MQHNHERRIEVAYSKQEVVDKIEHLRIENIMSKDIHLFSKDMSQFEDLRWEPDIELNKTGNWVDQFKSWFTDDTAIEAGLKQLNLSPEENARYSQILVNGGTLLVIGDQFDEPFDRSLTSTDLNQPTTNLQRDESLEARERFDNIDTYRRRI